MKTPVELKMRHETNHWKNVIPRGSNFIKIQHLAMKTSVGQAWKNGKINVLKKYQMMDLQHLAMKTKVLSSKKEQKVPKTLSCRQNIASKMA